MSNSIDFLIEPKEEFLMLTKPTVDFLQRVLAAIKNCQVENIPCEIYIKSAHDMIETFVNQPLEK